MQIDRSAIAVAIKTNYSNPFNLFIAYPAHTGHIQCLTELIYVCGRYVPDNTSGVTLKFRKLPNHTAWHTENTRLTEIK